MQNIEPLVLDLVEWIDKKPRAYTDVVDAWRTSCPRLTVWEDAVDYGFLTREKDVTFGQRVVVTEAGRRFLERKGRKPVDQ
jgi:hypothetical protein